MVDLGAPCPRFSLVPGPIHAADGVIPSDLATGDEEEIEEERRLLYVAMTRAKNRLALFFPLHPGRGEAALHQGGRAHRGAAGRAVAGFISRQGCGGCRPPAQGPVGQLTRDGRPPGQARRPRRRSWSKGPRRDPEAPARRQSADQNLTRPRRTHPPLSAGSGGGCNCPPCVPGARQLPGRIGSGCRYRRGRRRCRR